ncbi:MAG: type I-F CRISPR-associated protein Csy3 [Campylobacterota bacterium]|nr:type I-F CRISPR-associated protein Csy3 [Campylobacterota bacterium]
MAKIKVASVLSFEKKLVPSDGYMYGTSWENRSEFKSLKLIEKSVRGTISNRLKDAVKKDPIKLNAEVEKPNLQRVDVCTLSPYQDTLKLYFTLKVLGGLEPSACNSKEFKTSYTEAINEYTQKEKFRELGKRYALNIANARFLWRNRVGAENIEINVTSAENSWSFDALKFNPKSMECDDKDVIGLGEKIAQILASKDDFLLLEIECFAKIGNAQIVYPSEELVLDKGKGTKSKILYETDGIAAMHEQKIGNALRSIDTWYSAYATDEGVGAIAVEPYGAVTNLGVAFRGSDKKDFFTLFDKFATGIKLENIEDEHYVVATLIRGGVFGESAK